MVALTVKTSEPGPLLGLLTGALAASWARDTAVDPGAWSSDNPSGGQCAVTALVIQDVLGGELLRGEVAGASHYWNRLPDGEEIDLTRGQFASFTLDAPPTTRDRDYLLRDPETRRRYELMNERVRTAFVIA